MRLEKIGELAAGLIIIAAFAGQSYGQTTLGARPLAMGQATTALPDNPWAMFENPAVLSEKQKSVSFFAIRYYSLPELTDVSAALAYPTKIGVLAGGAHHFGKIFSKTRIRLAYKNSWNKFHYGVTLNYNHIKQGGGYGSLNALGINVGIAAEITDDLWLAAKATNINHPKYGITINDIDEDLPRNLSIGFSYQLSNIALFTADILKDVNFPISFRSGLEVKIIEHLKARAGITTKPITFAGGFGYNAEHWGVNLVVQKHENPVLGFSPGADFRIRW
ncbi:MAG TPA: hypothetical protein VK106_06595 [Balneolaceae bacterium]|nr:hypothetical protein [Balneolaceae bacterium]